MGVGDESLTPTRSATEQKSKGEANNSREQNSLDWAPLDTPGRIVDEIFHRVTPIFDRTLCRLHTIVDTICDVRCELRRFAESFAYIAGLIHEGFRHFVYN